jgi:hypothetical protein
MNGIFLEQVMIIRSVSSCCHGIGRVIIAQINRSYPDPFRKISYLNISFLAIYFNIILVILGIFGAVLFLFFRLGRSEFI